MPKHAIRIPAGETGRRVRWMLEVSAAAQEGVVSGPKTSRKHSRSKRMKKPSSSQAPTRVATAGPPPAPATARRARLVSAGTGGGIVVGGLVAVGAVLALIGYPSTRVASVAENTKPATLAQPVDVPERVRSESRPAPLATPRTTVASSPVSKAVVEKNAEPAPVVPTRRWPPDLVPSPPPAVAAARVASPSDSETVVSQHVSDAPASAATSDAVSQTVTLSGCLETTVDESQFRLTDTQGVDAPKARSWRSGFLKRRSAAVELVEFSDALVLRKHVGHRVVATGLLMGRELRVRSLRTEGPSCD
jgi:hypothetical protein